MKKITLLKTLMLAVCLLVGGSAWAETLVPTVKMTYVDYSNPTTSNGEIAAGETARTGYNNLSGTYPSQTVGFANTGWGCNWITYLQIDASALPSGATVTAASITFDQSGATDSKRTTGVGAGYNSSTWSSTMTYNTADKTITKVGDMVWTTTKAAGTFESKTINITAAFADDADNIVTILLYETAAAGCYIKNPTASITYTTAAAANYTIKYVANIAGTPTEIKDSRVETGIVGETASIANSDKSAIWYEGVKYLYSSDNASSTTIAEGNSSVVTVTFTEAPSYTYTVDDNLSNNLASGSVYEGEKFSFGVPYYVFKDGKFYQSPSLSSGTLSYGAGTSPVINSNTEITVTYTEEASTNVVFYSEAENLAGITVQDDGFTQIRMSNKKAGYYASSTAFVTLPAGVYTLTSSTRSGTTRFYAGEVGSGREIMSLASGGTVETTTSDPFILAEETKIYTSVGSASAYFDYVIIRKTGDLPATEKIVVTSAGFATYVSNYNLDFTSATTKAYKVNVASKGVATLTQVDEVPAKTPVLLYVSGGNGEGETIPVTTDAVSAVSGNDLVAGTGAAVATDGGDYTNMILNYVDSKIGFYFANGQTVATNRAYLHIANAMAPAAEARMVMIFADDETTGISDASRLMDNGKMRNDNFFNLNGQRVEKPVKGLYIKNGKKVVMK